MLTLIVGGVVSLISIGSSGQSSPPQAVSKDAAVHREMALATVDAVGATTEIVFTLAGTKVAVVVVAIGHIVLAAIQVLVRTFLTALFVFSTNLLALDSCFGDSIELIELSWFPMEEYDYYGKIYSRIYCYIFYLKSQGLLKITCYFRDYFYK
ncbi:hypothetical protein IKO50_04520 [bacterium]|nr:hypothetical protein [bacterium]